MKCLKNYKKLVAMTLHEQLNKRKEKLNHFDLKYEIKEEDIKAGLFKSGLTLT